MSNPLDLQVAGLDPSLRAFGWASPHGVGTIRSVEKAERRLVEIRTGVLKATRGCHLAVIEGPSYGSTFGRELAGGLQWVVRVALFGNRCTSVIVAPKTVKKFATGNGGADKDAMVDAARAELLYGGDSDDEADALWLRAMGMAAYGVGVVEMNDTRTQVLGTVEWPVGIAA